MNPHFRTDEEMRFVYLFNISDFFTYIILYMGDLFGVRIIEKDSIFIVLVEPGISDRVRLFAETFHR